MARLRDEVVRATEEHDFSGALRVDRPGHPPLALARGLADRAHGVPNEVSTRFAIASGNKPFTALTVMALVGQGLLRLDTRARDLLGDDLPEIDDGVTVEHFLAHRSGIGDYVDEDADLDIDDHVLTVPVHTLETTEDYLPALAGRTTKFPPGERFSYCNGGYVVLALLAERASRTPFPELVDRLVCAPAGMADTAFLRSDELPGRTARGYLRGGGLRTNVLHLPVRGSGDGGAYSTLDDVHRFWDALLRGRILAPPVVAEMLRPRSDTGDGRHYGLGFWLSGPYAVRIAGYDAGVSFQSVHDRAAATTVTVMSNTSDGVWPVARRLLELVG